MQLSATECTYGVPACRTLGQQACGRPNRGRGLSDTEATAAEAAERVGTRDFVQG